MNLDTLKPVDRSSAGQCTKDGCNMPEKTQLVIPTRDGQRQIALCEIHLGPVLSAFRAEAIPFAVRSKEGVALPSTKLCERIQCLTQACRKVRIAGPGIEHGQIMKLCEECAMMAKAEFDAKPGFEVWIVNL